MREIRYHQSTQDDNSSLIMQPVANEGIQLVNLKCFQALKTREGFRPKNRTPRVMSKRTSLVSA